MLARRKGRDDPRRPDRRRRRAADRRLRGALQRAHPARRRRPRLERARQHQPGRADDRLRARARRAGARRRRAGGAAPRGRRAGARLRLLRVLGPQDVRPDRHRRPLRPRRAARGDAAVQGRRRHDPHGDVREDDLQHDPAQVRGRHAADRRGDRPRRGGRLPVGDRHAGDRGPRARVAALRDRADCGELPGVRILGTAARQGGGAVVRRSMASIRTTSAPCSTRKGSRCAPATIARSR